MQSPKNHQHQYIEMDGSKCDKVEQESHQKTD